MKKISQRTLIPMGMSLLLLLATQFAPAQAVEIKLQRQGEYTFITGGLSDEETAFLDAQSPKFPIQLTFRSGGQTQGVKDVTVRVRNVRGEVDVETVAPRDERPSSPGGLPGTHASAGPHPRRRPRVSLAGRRLP